MQIVSVDSTSPNTTIPRQFRFKHCRGTGVQSWGTHNFSDGCMATRVSTAATSRCSCLFETFWRGEVNDRRIEVPD
jgi:hypothetical protein